MGTGIKETSDLADFARIPVDQQQTSLEEGREFRIVRKVAVSTSTPVVFKFTSSVDFILFEQSLSVSAGDIELFAYREADAGASGSFSEPVPIFGKNISSEYRRYGGDRYETGVTITTGGAITPTGDYVDYDRARTSNATAQQTSVSGSNESKRMLAAGTYYIQLKAVADAEGKFGLSWEERV